jgi:hypothetical protein
MSTLGGALGVGDGWMAGKSDGFPSPFFSMASLDFPETMSLALRMVEHIFMSQATYRQATDRVLSYFLTDIEFGEAGDDEKDKWKNFLDETLDIKNTMHTVGLDAMCYGNSFTSVLPVFKRHLSCPKCFFEAPLAKIFNNSTFRFRWSDYQFHATCPKCKTSGKWRHIDRRAHHNGGFRIKRWNPHEIELLWDPLTDETAYIWKIPEDYRKMIREGHLYHLERASWEVIQAIKHNNYLLFDKDVIYHFKEDALSGVRNRGWGISRVLANFRQAWYVQVLHRYNEAIALDYVIPFRLITPAPGDKGAGTDPLLNYNMGDFSGQVMSMIAKRRKDPAAWNFLPFPVQYQALGGDASQLAPKDLLDQGIDTLLNAIGVPAEMYKGTLTLQSAPAALRLFESTWSTLPHNLNAWLRFIIKQAAQLNNWEKVDAKLMRVTHADDISRSMAKLQLYTGGQISATTGLGSVGLDYKDEIRRKNDEQRYEAEESAKLQEQMDNAATQEQMAQPQGGQPGQPGQPGGDPSQGGQPAPGGQQAPGGQPAGPMGAAQQSVTANLPLGDNVNTTPQELEERANYLATQLLGLPASQRDQELQALKSKSLTLYSITKDRMQDVRSKARSQGQQQVMQQMFPKQGNLALPSAEETLKYASAKNILKYRRSIRLKPN